MVNTPVGASGGAAAVVSVSPGARGGARASGASGVPSQDSLRARSIA